MTMELFRWSGHAGTLNPGDVAAWVTELCIEVSCASRRRSGNVAVVDYYSKVKDVVTSSRGTNLTRNTLVAINEMCCT